MHISKGGARKPTALAALATRCAGADGPGPGGVGIMSGLLVSESNEFVGDAT
jgi:hypothetical protein